MAKELPKGFGLWSATLQNKWIEDNKHLDPRFDACECGCNRAQHMKDRGMCHGTHCTCTRFVKRTRRFVHLKMACDALAVAIDVIESLPGDGRSIKVGIPDRDERLQLIRQLKAAIAGPVESTAEVSR